MLNFNLNTILIGFQPTVEDIIVYIGKNFDHRNSYVVVLLSFFYDIIIIKVTLPL